jgi:hypothetical protein
VVTKGVIIKGVYCNKNIELLLLVSDWLIIMIGPGGLLLVASHIIADTVLVLLAWGGVGKT